MKVTFLRARALACALLATSAYCGLTAEPAAAQTARQHRALDGNGVDLTHGDFVMSHVEGSIGSASAELALVRNGVWFGGMINSNGHQWDRIYMTQALQSDGSTMRRVALGARSETFATLGTLPTGSSLSADGEGYQYRTADGTAIHFSDPSASIGNLSPYCNGSVGQNECALLPTEITSPNGSHVTLEWTVWYYCPGLIEPESPPDCDYAARIARVSNSFGYSIAFTYGTDTHAGPTPPPAAWHRRTGATFHNSAAGTGAQASVAYAYPATGVTEVTDPAGRVWRFTGTAEKITSIRRPGAGADTTTIAYGGAGDSVTSIVNAGVTTQYSRSVTGNTAETTVTQVVPDGPDPVAVVVSHLAIGRPTSIRDPLNRTTSFSYDSSGRLKRTTAPEGNYVELTYDARGNILEQRAVAKPGSALPDMVTSAQFPSACANPRTCNSPESVTDARGQVTDFTYEPDHGGVLTATGPAPAPGSPRPQTRYTYALTENGDYRLTGVSQCRTTSSCAGGTDEVKSSVSYDANGNVLTSSAGNGTGSLTATSQMTYDALGNLPTVDGPLPGDDDKVRFRYNSARELIGMVGPDPDGPGANLRHRALRKTLDATTGLVTKVERGIVEGQSDPEWAAFSSLEEVQQVYDADRRPSVQKVVAAGTVHALTQTGYDALGRVECVARRMDGADFGTTLPAACTLTSPDGAHGPDRISRTYYDLAGQITEVRSAVGTAQETRAILTTYRDNGGVETVKDGENNLTTYEYDGHDRLKRTKFPAVLVKGESDPNNFEEIIYETVAGGSRASPLLAALRNRAEETIGFTYDALGRLTFKDRPGTEPDVTFAYDLLGQMTGASQNGHALSFAYDALGRKVSETGPLGTVASEWDLAGRRTKLTWPDNFAVFYDYLVTGEMTRIRERDPVTGQPVASGISVLATFGYDPTKSAGQLGLRTSLAFGNGNSTSYAYDPASRLSQLKQDFEGTGTANDLILDFTYNHAGQIVSTERSNDLYAWTGHGSGTTATSANGLNQIDDWVTNLTYDSKGNIIADGSYGYTYSSENLLTSLTNPSGTVQTSSTYAYDPLMRLAGIDSSNSGLDAQLAHDGEEIVLESLSSNRARRYVFGPGVDEPLVSYLVTSTGTTRSWHQADERGSTLRLSNDGGTPSSGVGRYDEYGLGTGVSRFHYTGQYWLGDADLHYYRARIYNPRLGRFLQPDPSGYAGGLNLYAYVSADPVNFLDPSGLGRNGICDGGTCGDIFVNWGGIPGGYHGNQLRGGTGGHLLARAPSEVAPGLGNPLNWPHGEPPVRRKTPQEKCQAAIDTIRALTEARLGTEFDADTLVVLKALAFGGPKAFAITPSGMARLQQTISARPGGLANRTKLGNGVSRYTFNFASGREMQYYGYGKPSTIDALLGRATVYMRGVTLVGVSDRFDYSGSYSESDIEAGVNFADELLTAQCPNRQGSITITGGTVP